MKYLLLWVPTGILALQVARPQEETLESTWKTITEGQGPQLARHLKMSDTSDTFWTCTVFIIISLCSDCEMNQ
jgi:hypothetical protein